MPVLLDSIIFLAAVVFILLLSSLKSTGSNNGALAQQRCPD